MSAPPRILRESSLYLLGNVAGRAIGFIMIPFYAHYLSPAQYGIVSLVELATSMVSIVFGLQSIGESLARIYHDQPDERGRRRAVSTAVLLLITAGGVLAAIAAALAGPIAQAASLSGNEALLRAGFAGMFLGYLQEIALVHARIRGRAGFVIAYTLANTLVTVSFNVLFIGVLGFGVWGFISSKLIVAGCGSLGLLLLTLHEVGAGFDASIARALVRFAAPLVASAGAYFAIHFSDRIFLGGVSKAQVGIYAMAYNFALLVSVLVGDSFSKSWDVRLYHYAKNEGWQSHFVQVGRYFVLAAGIASGGIALLGHDMLLLMVPASYLPPLLLIPTLVLAYLCREIGDFFRNMLLIDIGSGLAGLVAVFCAILNLSLNAWLIPVNGPIGGIWGAAIATLLTWAAYAAIAFTLARRVHKIRFPITSLATMLAMILGALAIQTQLRTGGPISQLAIDAALGLSFLALVWTLYLRPPERADILTLARSQLNRLRQPGQNPLG